jgi:hypothetical protein
MSTLHQQASAFLTRERPRFAYLAEALATSDPSRFLIEERDARNAVTVGNQLVGAAVS